MEPLSVEDCMSASEIIGLRLRKERQRLGLSATQLGERTGICRMSQANYESGKRSPTALYLLAAYRAGVDVNFVITGKRAAP